MPKTDKKSPNRWVWLRGQHGFTLTEMAVVVGVITILVTLAIPNYSRWQRKYDLRSSVSELQGQLGIARMNAINLNADVTATIDQPSATSPVTVTFGGAYRMAPLTMKTGVSLTNANSVPVDGATVSSPQDVRFTSLGFRVNASGTPNGGNNLCINSAGSAYIACAATAAQALNFKNTAGDNYRIVILPTGKISMCYTSTCPGA